MIVHRLFVLACLLTTACGLHIDEGCVAKSEWKEEISWLEFRIGAWVQASKDPIIQLKIDFHDWDEAISYDKFKIAQNSYEFIRRVDLDDDKKSYNTSVSIKDGWNEFLLHVKDVYTFWYMGDNERHLLFEHEVNYKPKYLTIKGEHITLNCPTEIRVWEISSEKTAVVAPLDSSDAHQLGFYSNHDMRPIIILDTREISLGWDGNSITTTDKQPLPPYHLYNVSLTCKLDSRIICIFQVVDGTKLEEVTVTQIPESISFKKQDGGSYSYTVILQPSQNDSTSQTEAPIIAPANISERIVIVSLVLVLVIVIILILLYCIQKMISRSKKKSDEADYPKEMESLISRAPTIRDDVLTDAVMQNNLQQVKHLLSKSLGIPRNFEKAYKNAHLLNRRDIIKELDSIKKLDREPLIRWVMKEYNDRVKKIFQAAKKGRYQPGVASLLKHYDLPATIRDEQGQTILHVIASAKDTNGVPRWTAENIKKFLSQWIYYPNAVDYKGRTCLHMIAEAASSSKDPIIWNSGKTNIEDAWVDLAKTLVEEGCIPTIADDKGNLPQKYSKEQRHLKLAEILEKFIPPTQSKTKFEDLMNEVKTGQIDSIMKAMTNHPDLLPLKQTQNPLTKAVTRGHLEATLLLISGGASICGLSQVTVTPLEAAHAVKDLPAIFPALLRRECINQLKFENNEARQEPKLENYMRGLIQQIENGQISGNMEMNVNPEHDDCKETRNLLCLAAGHGMSLACQVLGLMNINLHPLPTEPKPVLKAIENGHHKVINVLYRDLQMSPFAHRNSDKFSERFLEDVWDSQFSSLKKHCNPMDLDLVTNAHNGKTVELNDKSIFSLIARHGLDYIFHELKNGLNEFNVNDEVDDLTGCAMLHIAAMYGRFGMLEYLLYIKNINVMAKAKGDFTAAHLAAIKGHKECVKYLQNYMQNDHNVDDTLSNGGQSSADFLRGYSNLVSDSKLLCLPKDLGIEIWSVPSVKNKTRILLKKKFEKLDIFDDSSFLKKIKALSKYEMNSKEKEILEKMENLLDSVSVNDGRFKGSTVAFNSNCQLLDIPLESMQIYWEVDSPEFSEFKLVHDDKIPPSISVKFSSKEKSEDFTGLFLEAIERTIVNFSFDSSLTWLLYPSLTRDSLGITLLLQNYENGRSRLISVFLIPVLKTDIPQESMEQWKNPIFEDIQPSMYLANFSKDKWTYVTKNIEDQITRKLNENQKFVLTGCMLLTKILYSTWWYPMKESKRHYKTWETFAINIQTFPDRILTSLFLEEINSTNNDDWLPSKFLDRMIAIFKRASNKTEASQNKSKTITLLLDYPYSKYQCNTLIYPIIEFLEDLKDKNQILNEP